MKKVVEQDFNLIDEDWIPVAGAGKVSLRKVFTDVNLKALGGTPVEKIAMTKLLLAIAQAAHTPEDDNEWAALGASGMATKAMDYLEVNKDCFWLYGENPFLQMPGIAKAKIQNFSAVLPNIATGNTTILMESQIEQNLTDAEKSLVLVFLSGFALGGKKTDNSVILSEGYIEKSSTGKYGPSLGFAGYLHSFITGDCLCETIWLNMVTSDNVENLKQFPGGMGTPPWEKMPQGENCPIAADLKQSLMGRLVPLCRFVLLSDKGIHYSEGISYLAYKEGNFDLSISVDFSSKNPRVIWADPQKRPWRQLHSLLSFFGSSGDRSFDCFQIRAGALRAKNVVPGFGIWSGGFKVSSNAGEQYASGSDDVVESEVSLMSEWLGEIWFSQLKREMLNLEEMAKHLYGATMGYYKKLTFDGKKHAAQATEIFWQFSEKKFQELINACGDKSGCEVTNIRPSFINFANKAYNTICPRDTARQLDAWASSKPNLSRFFPKHDKADQSQKKEITTKKAGEKWVQMEMF